MNILISFYLKDVEMSLVNVRPCPMCGGKSKGSTFPYATKFNNVQFSYLECGKCQSVFVDPVPDAQTFARMYAKSAYHDQYYDGNEVAQYSESAQLLSKFLKPRSTVLDYGCGVGGFLKACASQGFVPFGVEFDGDAAQFAAKNANCEVMSVEAFNQLSAPHSYDAIHLGDVLEHLPNPTSTLKDLLCFLKPGGVLFAEGPLEDNPSPVFWSARVFGAVKRLMKPAFLPPNPPTHLLRTHADAQKAFFSLVDPSLTVHHWQVYETGWPYASGGFIKRNVASLAKLMGGQQFAGVTFGNRFMTILIKEQ